MRIDQLLVQRGLASTRSQAQRLIADGVQWQKMEVGGEVWKRVVKNGDDVPEDAPIQLLDDSEARYVSRGGLKLEAALKHVGLSVVGLRCLDVGQSTGGFTDCLLQAGAQSVVGVDVGSAQLHPSLRGDARVLCVEGVNARTLSATDLIAAYADSTGTEGQFDLEEDGETFEDFDDSEIGAEPPAEGDDAELVALPAEFAPPFDVLVADLSFISQTLVLPAAVSLLKAGGSLLTLVKPQFELQPGQVGKGGIVKDPAMYAIVEQRLREACAELGLTVTAWFDSSIEGGDGNREFFIFARKAG
ncbi:MAG: hemolysin [Curvibacter sp. RIFCSPHIGHO2_12_FULL_63_18]|uniref:TlyA family RNA methyltransferase n=1 Tax=Rhodoferax sp. TaxID=50421 RepID=UPI0008D3D99C|nr:TlyA family RNA methyltransferase [Rhodoferax sp.]OGP00556.1 MAG: hemolysin [Curvibacter sp. GWA2_63_95]OGP01761.1 MAG: hemolysin [Curvibacter sp. RIFCSPHIGHO2_12_FULL_63_18]HCX83458.1 hemolysin [Rhodoferax sp.]